MAFIAAIYSLYSLFTAGEQAMMGGALVTFFGWTLFGVVGPKLLGTKADSGPENAEAEVAAEDTSGGLHPATV